VNLPCDCCEGPRLLTPESIANRSGLSALRYRAGTHATFLETMLARLSGTDHPELAALLSREQSDASIALLDAWAILGDVLTFYQERIANEGYLRTATERRSVLELARLIGYALRPGVASTVYLAFSLEKDAEPAEIPQGTRANSVPAPGEQMQAFETAESIDARVEWNSLGPRLTQAQTPQSIADYGLYLKGTATNLKPNDPLLINLGSGPHFVRVERVEVDHARDHTRVLLRDFNRLSLAAHAVKTAADGFIRTAPSGVIADDVGELLRALQAATLEPSTLSSHLTDSVLPDLKGALHRAGRGATRLNPWLIGMITKFEAAAHQLNLARGATDGRSIRSIKHKDGDSGIAGIIETLKIAPSVPPANEKQLTRDIKHALDTRADTVPRLLAALQPSLQKVFYKAWKHIPPPVTSGIRVYAMRTAAAPFGHNAGLRQIGVDDDRPVFSEWEISDPWNIPPTVHIGIGIFSRVESEAGEPAMTPLCHTATDLYLDNDYNLSPDSLVVIEKPGALPLIVNPADAIETLSLAAYGLSGKSTHIVLPADQAWITETEPFATVRSARVYTGSEALEPAERPITDDIGDSDIELADLYEDLQPGRWLIVTGERTDISDAYGNPVSGVQGAELVMLAAVKQSLKTVDGVRLAEDTIHSFITLAEPLTYSYRRETVTIHGNVVKATHGETRQEVLGSGDASKALQQFTLRQPPLTYTSAPSISGIDSTLAVRVNEVLWHEAPGLVQLGPQDRKFITRTDDDAKSTVVFGNGTHGARLPSGQENIKGVYRNGIGKAGNVQAGQISLLASRPLGVKDVINPIRASGGADKETRNQARRNAPLAVMALDRLVSIRDYADFARTFAGVGKATATRLSDGRRQLVHVTIAGAEDIPIEKTSDLYRNLYKALHQHGDPYLPICLSIRERLALVISAKVRIGLDYLWESVEPEIRAALLSEFGFENMVLGQDLFLADALRVIQNVAGVEYVDIDIFDSITEPDLVAGFSEPLADRLSLLDRVPVRVARVGSAGISAAQLGYLVPVVPDTLILQEIKP
jgi:hypothetical protein